MKSPHVVVILLLAAMFSLNLDTAWSETDYTILPLTLPDRVYITNGTNRSLTFSLRVNNGEWKSFELGSGKEGEYKCEKCEGDTKWGFQITTEGRDSIRYRLKRGGQYVLTWNESSGSFDLIEAR